MTDLKRRSFIAALGATPFALPLLSKAESLLSYANDQQTANTTSSAHFTPTTDLNTHDPTAIVTLRGLGLACFGPSGYQSGFIPQRSHDYMLEIKESGPGVIKLLRPPELVTGNIRIEVDNPVRSGVFTYENGTCRRPNGSTDDRHFRWILDIEGEKLHGEPVVLRRRSQGAPEMLKVTIPHATFYTKTLGTTVYARINAKNNATERGELVGRVTQDVGAAIECKPERGSGVRIVFLSGKEPILLPRVEGLKYEINLYNLRRVPHPYSDFNLYYSVLRDPDGDEFDLAHVEAEEKGKRRPAKSVPIPPDKVRRGCCGAACDIVFVNSLTSLDQPT